MELRKFTFSSGEMTKLRNNSVELDLRDSSINLYGVENIKKPIFYSLIKA